jgi:saccharopine dehydrogenase-like NADP-dependent oxidoreductase
MPNALVLGAGMVGSVMAADLVDDPDFSVTIADVREEALVAARRRCGERAIRTERADLSDPRRIEALARDHDIVLGALSSKLGLLALRAVIAAGRNYCDISFMPEDAWSLSDSAQRAGVTAVVDCGVAPGMSNMMAGFGASQLDACQHIEIYVGGLPRMPRWPFLYKAGFSPHDVIEEYVRPARVVENGRVVVKEALSEPELMNFEGVGTLEAFNTDGLRSLAHFLKAPFMKEKTLRYPGHIEIMRIFRETGLFSEEPMAIRSSHDAPLVLVRPRDVTAALMFPKWTYEQGEEDLTVMRVVVEGERDGGSRRFTWDLLDFYDRMTQTTSMSRTTALPCTIIARMIASGEIHMPGVIPPEMLGRQPGLLDKVLKRLEQRGVRFTATVC